MSILSVKSDILGETELIEFRLNVFICLKFEVSPNLFNRAKNLALEVLVLATRLKVVKELNNKPLFYKIHKKIIDYIENLERFCKNKRVFKTISLVNDFISNLMD